MAPAFVALQLVKNSDQADRPVRGLQRPNQLFRKVSANEIFHRLKLQKGSGKPRFQKRNRSTSHSAPSRTL